MAEAVKSEQQQTAAQHFEKSRLLLVGVGGMGLNAVDTLQQNSSAFADIVAIDCDQDVLSSCQAPRRVLIGSRLTQGHSTGGDSSLGRRAANGDFPQLRELFTKTDLVVLLVGLGGGLGSGAAPVIANTARDEGALVITVATLPFAFEGGDRMKLAEEVIPTLRESGHGLVLMPNEDISEVSESGVSLSDALQQGAQELSKGFQLLWTLLGQRNLINLDFISLKNMLEHTNGACRLVYVEASGPNKAKLLVKRLEGHPALKSAEVLKDSSAFLLGVLGSQDMTLIDVSTVAGAVEQRTSDQAFRVVGAGIDPAGGSRMRALLLIGAAGEKGTEVKVAPSRELVERKPLKPVRPAVTKPAGRKQTAQEELDLPSVVSKGRFKNVEPTIVQGEDLDLPTFVRRGMKLSR